MGFFFVFMGKTEKRRIEEEVLTCSIINSMNVCKTCQVGDKKQVIKQLNLAGLFLFSKDRRVVANDFNLANVSAQFEILFLIN